MDLVAGVRKEGSRCVGQSLQNLEASLTLPAVVGEMRSNGKMSRIASIERTILATH